MWMLFVLSEISTKYPVGERLSLGLLSVIRLSFANSLYFSFLVIAQKFSLRLRILNDPKRAVGTAFHVFTHLVSHPKPHPLFDRVRANGVWDGPIALFRMIGYKKVLSQS
jgi:hypothetical protein